MFNLKPLNQHMDTKGFRMATVSTVCASVRQEDWAVSLDIKDAYFHVPIHQRHRRFLRFLHQGKAFQFKALPFGLSTAPRTFTKVTGPILQHCRARGIRIILYLDDAIILDQSRCLKD